MRKIIIFVIVMLLLTACSGVSKNQTPSQSSEMTLSNGYPTKSAYPGPESGYPMYSPENVPTATPPIPDPAKGNVSGTLLEKGKPIKEGMVCVARVVKDPSGNPVMAGYDRTTPNCGLLDQSGNFHIYNLEPMAYGLIYDRIANAFLMHKTDSEDSFLIDVTAGQTLDLGKLDYDRLEPQEQQ